jgi:hypothetical protein
MKESTISVDLTEEENLIYEASDEAPCVVAYAVASMLTWEATNDDTCM